MAMRGVVRDLIGVLRVKGGPGSGHRGHAGRPGLVGGSTPGAGGISISLIAMSAPAYEGSGSGSDKMDSHLSDNLPVPVDFDEEEVADMEWDGVEIEVAGEVKHGIVTHLSDVTGIPESDVNAFIHQWAETSNANPRSQSIQHDVTKEFGVPLSEWQQDIRLGARESLLPEIQQRKLLRAMYDNTQKQLSDAGFGPDETVRLFRGLKFDGEPDWKNGDAVTYKGNAIESWSVGQDTAREFGYIAVADVPRTSIFSTARSGFGCLSEGEVIVFGSIPGSTVLGWIEETHDEDIGW